MQHQDQALRCPRVVAGPAERDLGVLASRPDIARPRHFRGRGVAWLSGSDGPYARAVAAGGGPQHRPKGSSDDQVCLRDRLSAAESVNLNGARLGGFY